MGAAEVLVTCELQAEEISISPRTASRHLLALGLNRRRFMDPDGEANREPQKITARRPGHMVHVDGFSRLAYTEALPDEKAATAIAFMRRARVWFVEAEADRYRVRRRYRPPLTSHVHHRPPPSTRDTRQTVIVRRRWR